MSKALDDAMKQLDAKEGRVRLYRDEFEDFIDLYASVKMIRSCLDKMERLARLHPRTWGKLKCGFTLIEHAVVEMTTKISTKQYRMLRTNQGKITFQPDAALPRFSMDEDDYYRLVVAARIGACANCMSCLDRGEWSKCALMQTLDTVPCREGIHEKDQYDKGVCPYAIRDPNEFKEAARQWDLKT